jgi:hypothetical protein
MSRRIFTNIQNSIYGAVTQNRKGAQFGLGVPSQLSSEEQLTLGQRGNELYFTTEDLLEKKRKIQIIFDSFTDPKFFGDGSVDITKVQKYVEEIELEASKIGEIGTAEDLVQLAAGLGIAKTTIAIVKLGQLAVIGAKGAGIGLGGTVKLATNLFRGNLGALAIIATIGAIAKLIKSNRQAGREDNKAPWKMTRADFPRLTAQAIQGSPTRRSIERLYDRRQAIGGRNFDTKYAIARLVREALADALFSKVPPGGTVSAAVNEHPLNDDTEALAQPRHFPFRERTQGIDQTERTYVDAVLYLKSYIDLIDAIVNVRDASLSRSPDRDQIQKTIELDIRLSTAEVPLFTALTATAREVIREKVLTFFDGNREYKTLLNFGDDQQYVAEAWRLAPSNTGSLQLKLLRPLASDIEENTSVFISRELAKSVIDVVEFELSPEQDTTPYLRPLNMDSRNYVDSRMLATSTTLSSLGLTTGSAGAITSGPAVTYGDTVFRRWFTGDFNSSELNIDFTDYDNFVHFGSAYSRLTTFRQKLSTIELLTSQSAQIAESSSIAQASLRAQEKEYVIRTLDQYEQFLYFATGSISYSASAYCADGEVEFHTTAYWPKEQDGTPYSPTSATAIQWFDIQSAIAQRYDEANVNYLVYSLPTHIQEDIQSNDFIILVTMVGHVLDNLKVYADQLPNIYATSIDPLKDLSMDQVYEVAQSFGLKLPNVYALDSLQTFNAQFTGETGSRAYAAETWKRFLHNMVYLAKTKGSRTSFNALLNTYGISSPVLQLKETSYPSVGNYVQSDELTYTLRYTGSVDSFITIPLVSASLTGLTTQVSFKPTARVASSLITANGWAVNLLPHPSQSKAEFGKIQIVSGTAQTVIASSSYFPLFSDDFTHLMLRSQSSDVSIIQTDGDQILFKQSASVNWNSLWNTTQVFYLGGSGSIQLPDNFDGVVDEIRVWGENISDDDFISHAYDPGSFYAGTYTSAYDNLYVHVPFSQPLSSITQSVFNESPYENVSIVSTLPAVGFTTASYRRTLRSIKQFSPRVGSTVYTNKKVTVAEPPAFNQQFVDADGTYRLSRRESIKRLEDKKYSSGQNIVSFAISPTDFINQNIVRSMGVVSVNDVIGSPRYISGDKYVSLENIQKDYLAYFNKTINPNEYIRFFKNLVEGPSEAAQSMVPARAKLLDGIIIESSVLSRNKDTTVRSIKVDGSQTRRLNKYVAGSGSVDIGAYDFSTGIQEINLLPPVIGDTLLIDGVLEITDLVEFRSSTPANKRSGIQKIGTSFVTSSVQDALSSYSTLEADSINLVHVMDTVSDGYPRAPFRSINIRIESEKDTTVPFYEIVPRSNLYDVGTTSYFHKSSGIYSYDIYTLYKQPYLVKLDTETSSPIDIVYAPITLLDPSTQLGTYGRDDVTVPIATYGPGSRTFGEIRISNIFTLYGITGASNLRFRMYRTPSDRQSDASRLFATAPSLNSGVLFDGLLQGTQDVFPYVTMQSPDSIIYYTVDNLSVSPIPSEINLNYFIFEPDLRVPRGYLPRHYRFSRDNSTALKRRNYLGCKEVNLTADGLPPVSITLSGQNTVVVSTNTSTGPSGQDTVQFPQTDTITLGGGGRLNVE